MSKIGTSFILKSLNVIAWILFVALMVKAGSLLVSLGITFFVNPEGAIKFYQTLNLAAVFDYSSIAFFILGGGLALNAVLEALLFYYLVSIFERMNVVAPFSAEVASLISKMGYTALEIGFLSILMKKFSIWLIEKGVDVPPLAEFLSDESAFLMLGGIIFVLSVIFKRGIELQTENELTI